MPVNPPLWTRDQLEAERARSIEAFREERLREPVESYAEAVDGGLAVFETLLEETVDLERLQDPEVLRRVLADPNQLRAFRYLSGPPISEDDLQVLANAASLAPTRLRHDLDAMARIRDVVRSCLDRRRFPWVSEQREATPQEREAAILASAVLVAYQQIQTARRSEGKEQQEQAVADALENAGFERVPATPIRNIREAPVAGTFCCETEFGDRKADFVVGLFDRRAMPIECKVSNSELNSVKRLNNDAAVKATTWIADFGHLNVVPAAVLGGVFKLTSLEVAQQRGLALFWAHRLDQFIAWVESTRT